MMICCHHRHHCHHHRWFLVSAGLLLVTLFVEPLDERVARPGADFPVNVPNIVARNVLPVLGKLNACALERALERARQGIVHRSTGGEFNQLHALKQVFG
jgi:hypothetical protein